MSQTHGIRQIFDKNECSFETLNCVAGYRITHRNENDTQVRAHLAGIACCLFTHHEFFDLWWKTRTCFLGLAGIYYMRLYHDQVHDSVEYGHAM